MFSQPLRSQIGVLYTDGRKYIFDNIVALDYHGDETATDVLSLLMSSRVPDRANVIWGASGLTWTGSNVANADDRTLSKALTGVGMREFKLYSLRIDAYDALVSKNFDTFLTNAYPEFSRLIAVERFVMKLTGVESLVFNDEKDDRTLIFCKEITMSAYHLFVSFIPLFFPNSFKNNPLSEDEKTLLKSLTEKNFNTYTTCVKNALEKLNVRSMIIDHKIVGLSKRIYDTRISNAQNTLRTIANEVENLLQEYARVLKRKDDAYVLYEGLVSARDKASDDKELADYLKLNKNVDFVDLNSNGLDIIIKGLLTNFSVEAYERVRERNHLYSDFDSHRTLPAFRSTSNCKLLFDHIFADEPDLQIKTCAYYKLNFSGSVRAVSGFVYPEIYDDYLPNPHIRLHACLGGNGPLIQKQMVDGEIVGAIECCSASATSVNVLEFSATFKPFLQELVGCSKKVLVNSEGVEMTPYDALLWLKTKYNVPNNKENNE